MLPVQGGRDDDVVEEVDQRVTEVGGGLLGQLGGESGADLAGRGARRHRQGVETGAVVRDPVDEAVAEPAELLGGQVGHAVVLRGGRRVESDAAHGVRALFILPHLGTRPAMTSSTPPTPWRNR